MHASRARLSALERRLSNAERARSSFCAVEAIGTIKRGSGLEAGSFADRQLCTSAGVAGIILVQRVSHGGFLEQGDKLLLADAPVPICISLPQHAPRLQQAAPSFHQDPQYHGTCSARTLVSQCLPHMLQVWPKFRTFTVLSAVRKANSNWGMCSKHCNGLHEDQGASAMMRRLEQLAGRRGL